MNIVPVAFKNTRLYINCSTTIRNWFKILIIMSDLINLKLRNWSKIKEYEDQYLAGSTSDIRRSLEAFEGMADLAKKLGKIPRTDPKEGLEHIFYLAKALKFIRVHKPN